jgi:hypothetical protein
MGVKNALCAVTTIVTEEEREMFVSLADELEVPCNALMRRLVIYFMDDKISWESLFKKNGGVPPADSLNGFKNVSMRTQLKPERHAAFTRRAKDWGSSPSVILRQLMALYGAGKIGWGDILYK